jgi:hypothetical protein
LPNSSQVSSAWTGHLRARAATDLDLVPAGLASERQQNAGVLDLDLDLDRAAAVGPVVARAVEADEVGAPRPRGEAEQQRPVAQPAQVEVQRAGHGEDSSAETAAFRRGGVPCARRTPGRCAGRTGQGRPPRAAAKGEAGEHALDRSH